MAGARTMADIACLEGGAEDEASVVDDGGALEEDVDVDDGGVDADLCD